MDITRGVILIHSAPAALCPHLEWAVSAATGSVVRFDWAPQPAEPRSQRAEHCWSGKPGTGAAVASALGRCERARFEVTEEPTGNTEGQRWAFTPRLGAFAAVTGPHGDIMVHENRLKRAIAGEALGAKPLQEALEDLLGTRWDDELEAFRHAGEGSPVRWLHAVS
jgi:hypothetical protein